LLTATADAAHPQASLTIISAVVHGCSLSPAPSIAHLCGTVVCGLASNRVKWTGGEWEQLMKLIVWTAREGSDTTQQEALRTLCDLAADDLTEGVARGSQIVESLTAITLISQKGVAPEDRDEPALHTAYTSAVGSVHQKFLGCMRSHGVDQSWIASWRRLLQCVAAVSVASAGRNPRLSSDSLLSLQRFVLDPGLSALDASGSHSLFDGVILPLVERICVPRAADSKNSPANNSHASVTHSVIANALSPSLLISSIFGPMAGKATAAVQQRNAVVEDAVFNDEMQCRAASMLPKAFLHLVASLTSDSRNFLPLWQRVLGLLFAIHSAPSSETGLLREAVQESVRNVVLVLATMAQHPDHRLLFAPFPTFWSTTRQVVKSFDFGPQLASHLDELGLTDG